MKTIQELEKQYIINTYNRQPDQTPCFTRGEGSYLWDEKGKRYLDFLSGLAVNVVGHCHPVVVEAIKGQAEKLSHTSNLYYTEPQVELARILVENTLSGAKVFFANSGAEANEAAIKLARKNRPGKYKIITAKNSFHGRTMGTVTATGQQKYQDPFKPLLDGFSHAIFNDLDSFEQLVDDQTAAIMIEPIQGEGGVHIAEESFLKGLRDLCDRKELLLIFDEVQSGIGRTGKLWAYQNWSVEPDLLTAAKGLGGGLPIGAMLAGEPYTEVLQPGDHASTFGGNPIVCTAALAVMDIIMQEGFLEAVSVRGATVKSSLNEMISKYPALAKEFRGKGLICALELNKPLAKKIQEQSTSAGLLVNAIGDIILRLLPPLTISEVELNEGLLIINEVVRKINE